MKSLLSRNKPATSSPSTPPSAVQKLAASLPRLGRAGLRKAAAVLPTASSIHATGDDSGRQTQAGAQASVVAAADARRAAQAWSSTDSLVSQDAAICKAWPELAVPPAPPPSPIEVTPAPVPAPASAAVPPPRGLRPRRPSAHRPGHNVPANVILPPRPATGANDAAPVGIALLRQIIDVEARDSQRTQPMQVLYGFHPTQEQTVDVYVAVQDMAGNDVDVPEHDRVRLSALLVAQHFPNRSV